MSNKKQEEKTEFNNEIENGIDEVVYSISQMNDAVLYYSFKAPTFNENGLNICEPYVMKTITSSVFGKTITSYYKDFSTESNITIPLSQSPNISVLSIKSLNWFYNTYEIALEEFNKEKDEAITNYVKTLEQTVSSLNSQISVLQDQLENANGQISEYRDELQKAYNDIDSLERNRAKPTKTRKFEF